MTYYARGPQLDYASMVPERSYAYFSDFLMPVTGDFTNVATGGGGVTNSFAPAAETEAGIAYVYAGNTGAGRSVIRTWMLNTFVHSASWQHRMSAKFRWYTLATAANDYITRVGYLDSDSTTPANGWYFEHTRGGNILAIVRNASGTSSSVDTGLADSQTYKHYEIECVGTDRVTFKINGAVVSNYTGGSVPTGSGKPLAMSAGCYGTAWTAGFERAILMDWFGACGFTTARRST